MSMVHWPYWVLGISALAAAAALFALLRGERSSRAGEIEAELAYQSAQATYLGDLLGRERAGRPCALLVFAGDPFAEAFVRGADGRLGDVRLVEVAPEEPSAAPTVPREAAAPLSLPRPERTERTWTPAAVGRLLAECAGDARLVVIAVPLPDGCFGASGAPALEALQGREVVLAAGCGLTQAKAARNGALLAAVRCREDAVYDGKPCPKDVRAAFAQRYELLSAELMPPAATQKETAKP